MDISVTLTPEAQRAVERMKHFPADILRATRIGMDRATKMVTSNIIRNRLSGKGPFPVEQHKLGEVTHNLKQTTLAVAARIEGDSVISAIGTNARYARVHEYGYSGQVYVPEFTRHDPRRDVFRPVSVMKVRGKRKVVKEQLASGMSVVRAHTRWMSMPARAPFTTGIVEGLPIFNEEINKELVAELNRPSA